ncbi:hypothetical protein SAMN02910413_0646 [Pseudobutyrivibrio sp. C4]|uniref:hypothetical protein n=1 Tax=Pseudobutyrivibrio sp. C4 TaxID=1520803 RepID=UPI0008CEB18C|nr:hypothetical protein [Pseudobutyrivibrio sp. C4]SES72644.1 hypothetical protein SAMN02910413_0646 [Pseudobutyrivibrio sp. C4]
MMDKKYRKKNGKAYRVIWCNTFKLVAAVICLLITLVCLIGAAIIPAVLFLALTVLEFYRYNEINNVADNIREYGVLMVNHPEYTVYDFSKALKRDTETVNKDIEKMLKKKVLFGTTDQTKFTLDDDFNLRILLEQNGWASAVFVN